MRPRLLGRNLMLAALAAVAVALPARAAVTVYYHAGSWDVFDGTGDDGRPVCGVGNRNPADGRAFSLRFAVGGDDVTFIASKPNWQIPGGTTMPVVMQVGLEQPWNTQATGSGQRVQWTLGRDVIAAFDSQFRRASSLTLTFPAGSEPPWVVPLNGSTAASDAMGRCVTDLMQRTGAQAGGSPQSPTQPFANPPSGQGNENAGQSGSAAPPAASSGSGGDQTAQPPASAGSSGSSGTQATQPNASH